MAQGAQVESVLARRSVLQHAGVCYSFFYGSIAKFRFIESGVCIKYSWDVVMEEFPTFKG